MEENNQSSKIPQYPPQYSRSRRKSRWWIPVLVIGLVLVGFFIILAVIVSQFGSTFEKKPVDVTENSILYLTFSNGLPEYSQTNPFAFFGGSDNSGATFFETIRAIKNAKNDNRIKGIYINPAFGSSIGFAKSVEIYDALMDFKKSGKFIYSFLEVGDENSYYLVLPSDSIFMPTEGMLEMNGYGVSSIFLKDFFNKIGIDYYVIHFEDYKSAGEMFDRTKFSDSAKAQLRVLLNQRLNYFVKAIVENRKKTKQEIMEVLDRGQYLADSLKNLGFVDVLTSEGNVREFLKYKANGDEFKLPMTITTNIKDSAIDKKYEKKLKLISPEDYLPSIKTDKKEIFDDKTQIAIINGVGPISSGSGSSSGDYEIKSKDFIRNLRKARNNDKVKAIIIRIESPGGSVIASDEIWEEIIKTRTIKPVYASMSNVAASGGYYMAMACDTIIAHPCTITGSIGVVMAIPNISGTMSKLGLSADTISTNKSSQFLNGMYPYSKENLDQLYNMSKGIYYRFINRVAESRKKTFDEIRAVAKGRVWTGQDAYERGLVDVLGGIQETIDLAKARLGVPLDKKIIVNYYPEKKDEFEEILRMFKLIPPKEDEGDAKNSNSKDNLISLLGIDKKQILYNFSFLSPEMLKQINYILQLLEITTKEKYAFALPYLIDIK